MAGLKSKRQGEMQEEGPADPEIIIVQVDRVRELVAKIFLTAGCSFDEAERISRRLTGANLRGHDSHGVIRVPRYVYLLQKGILLADQTLNVVTENEVLAVLDGCFGFGQTIGEQAVDVGISKSRQYGVSVIALRNSGHLGRIGDWAERAAECGLISIHLANVRGSHLVAPFGAKDRRLSTSPFCVGVPIAGEVPIILDFATSAVAEGKALLALKNSHNLPDETFIDEDGQLSGDPVNLYGCQQEGVIANANSGPGALRAFGEHKGSGLGFIIEILAGALTGSGLPTESVDPANRRVWNGMLSIYMSPDYFRQNDVFSSDVRSFVEFVKSSRPTDSECEVLIPGDTEIKTMKKRLENGLPFSQSHWHEIEAVAVSLGVNG